jgi:hypothetical protein
MISLGGQSFSLPLIDLSPLDPAQVRADPDRELHQVKHLRVYSSGSVGGRHLDHRFSGIQVRGISFTLTHRWLKSSYETVWKMAEEILNRVWLVAQDGEMGPLHTHLPLG